MRPVDCHCHLFFDQFENDREKVIEDAAEKLEFVVTAGTGPDTNEEVLELANGFEAVVPNLGIHPTSVGDFDRVEEVKRQVRKHDPPAIGEIGLDRHHIEGKQKRQNQEKVFRQMLELASELGKPVVVHSREAEMDAVEILDEYQLEDVMLHCFNGSPELAEKASQHGMMIGITTQVLYSSHVQEIASKVPIESVLLETDSPFLYPDGRNEPSHVIESVEKLAELKNMEGKEVTYQTTRNAQSFFDRQED